MSVPVLTDKPVSRLFFVDHLRAALVILVVLHHFALVYGASAPFYYVEPPFNDTLTYVLLLIFVLFNQSFFMGALFLIAGYFTPEYFERKGTVPFLKDKLLRLGLPAVVFTFVLGPIACLGFYAMPSELTGITTPFTLQDYPKYVGVGPLWFAVMLLLFSLGYAAWRAVTKDRPAVTVDDSAFPGYRVIGAFTLALALASYLVRIVLPIGATIPYAGFPTLSYLPQYVSFFILGVLGSRRGWLITAPDAVGKRGFIAALVATILLFPLALSGGAGFLGGGSPYSLAYALWDSIVAVGMFLGLLTLFRRRFAWQGRLGRLLSQQSFAVYVVHPLVIVLVGVALRGIQLPQLLKFGLAAVIGVPLCFAVAYLIRRIPLAARII